MFEYPNADSTHPKANRGLFALTSEAPLRKVRLGMIGAGNYAKSMLLPHFHSLKDLSLVTICTSRGMNAEALAERYRFRNATTDAAEIFKDPEINTVAVATRHDSHGRYAQQALEAGKSVYVEKPLAMNDGAARFDHRGTRQAQTRRSNVMGRLQPAFRSVEPEEQWSIWQGVPVRQVSCTIRKASMPGDSWYQDPAEGGGMLFGDVCHFIDLAIWFQQSLPLEVHAFATSDPSHGEESWMIQLRFANGGLSTVHYVCGSQQGFVGETVDILGGGRSARISGFRKLALNDGRRTRNSSLLQPDFGQKAMLEAMMAQFSRAARSGRPYRQFHRRDPGAAGSPSLDPRAPRRAHAPELSVCVGLAAQICGGGADLWRERLLHMKSKRSLRIAAWLMLVLHCRFLGRFALLPRVTTLLPHDVEHFLVFVLVGAGLRARIPLSVRGSLRRSSLFTAASNLPSFGLLDATRA